jgi:hypothetical protein
MKTISKFRVQQELQVITTLGDSHVVLGQKNVSVFERFFVVRNNFESALASSSSVVVDAEMQRDTRTGRVSFVNYSGESHQLEDLVKSLSGQVDSFEI